MRLWALNRSTPHALRPRLIHADQNSRIWHVGNGDTGGRPHKKRDGPHIHFGLSIRPFWRIFQGDHWDLLGKFLAKLVGINDFSVSPDPLGNHKDFAISMAHIIHGAKREFEKMGKLWDESLYRAVEKNREFTSASDIGQGRTQ